MQFSKTIALALAAGVVTSAAFAEEEQDTSVINGYFGADVKTGYISNGRLFVDDPVIQPYAGILWNGFDFNIWASEDLKNDTEHEFEEIDYTLAYGGSLEDLNLDYTVGGVIWAYDNYENDYRAYAELTYTGIKDIVTEGDYLKPGVYVRYNIANADHHPDHGIYGQFKLTTGCTLDDAQKIGLKLAAAVGYADSDYRRGSWSCGDSGFVDIEVTASLSYAVTKQLSVNIGCLYDSIIDDDLRDVEDIKQDDGKSDHFVGFVGFNVDL